MVYGLTSFVHLLSSYLHRSNSNNTISTYKPVMDSTEFRVRGREMVEYICEYLDNIDKRRVVPSIEPGYLKKLIPTEAPSQAESFDDVLTDFEKHIMPGLTHWQHPRFHAYFPAGNSYPSILADMLSDAIGCVGFSWAASPACSELEAIVLDWLGKMISLPETFLSCSGGKGGGVIQTSASECILVSMLAARFETVRELKKRFPFVEEGVLLSKLIAYCSKEAHSSVEKACMIGFVKLRILEPDAKFRLRGNTLSEAIEEDRSMGLVPFFVSTTLGTTSCCSFDAVDEIGPICQEENLWLHVDAAYAGAAFICEEFKYLMKGVEHAMSFNMNPNKWMLVNFDCSTMWVRDRFKLTQALVVDPLYLQHSYSDTSIDYRHWGIPLSRRFRSLKLWFVIRMYGVEGLQTYIREHVRLAKLFEKLVLNDDRFEVIGDTIMGLVTFRLKHCNELNKKLLTTLNASGRIHMVPASVRDTFVIRFCVCAERATDLDIHAAWDIIEAEASRMLDRDTIAKRSKSQEDSGHRGLTSVNGDFSDTEDDANESETMDQLFPGGLSAEGKRNHSLEYKRSFFVRMVSDPKCYNPKIVRTLSQGRHRLSEDLHRDLALRKDLMTSKPASIDTGVQTPI